MLEAIKKERRDQFSLQDCVHIGKTWICRDLFFTPIPSQALRGSTLDGLTTNPSLFFTPPTSVADIFVYILSGQMPFCWRIPGVGFPQVCAKLGMRWMMVSGRLREQLNMLKLAVAINALNILSMRLVMYPAWASYSWESGT